MKDELKNLDPETWKEIENVAAKMLLKGSVTTDFPDWYDPGTHKIDEVAFCAWFIDRHPLKYVGGLFYDMDGLMADEVTG